MYIHTHTHTHTHTQTHTHSAPRNRQLARQIDLTTHFEVPSQHRQTPSYPDRGVERSSIDLSFQEETKIKKLFLKIFTLFCFHSGFLCEAEML